MTGRIALLLSAFALLVASASAVTAGPHNVVNPMTSDLDGGGFHVSNVSTLIAGQLISDGSVAVQSGVVYLDRNHNRPSIRWGTDDPRVTPPADAVIGSEYLRFANPGELWVKTGPFPPDWQRVALEP